MSASGGKRVCSIQIDDADDADSMELSNITAGYDSEESNQKSTLNLLSLRRLNRNSDNGSALVSGDFSTASLSGLSCASSSSGTLRRSNPRRKKRCRQFFTLEVLNSFETSVIVYAFWFVVLIEVVTSILVLTISSDTDELRTHYCPDHILQTTVSENQW